MSCQPGKFYSTTGLSRIFYCFRNTTIIQLGRPDNTECWIRNERRMLHYICVTGRRFAPLVLVLSGNSLDCRHSGWWRSFLLSPPPSAYATERRRRQQPLLPFNSEQNHQDVHHVMWLALLTGCIKSLLLLLLLVECGRRSILLQWLQCHSKAEVLAGVSTSSSSGSEFEENTRRIIRWILFIPFQGFIHSSPEKDKYSSLRNSANPELWRLNSGKFNQCCGCILRSLCNLIAFSGINDLE